MAAILEKFKSIITSLYEKANVSNLHGGKIEGADKAGSASGIAEVSSGGAKTATDAANGASEKMGANVPANIQTETAGAAGTPTTTAAKVKLFVITTFVNERMFLM